MRRVLENALVGRWMDGGGRWAGELSLGTYMRLLSGLIFSVIKTSCPALARPGLHILSVSLPPLLPFMKFLATCIASVAWVSAVTAAPGPSFVKRGQPQFTNGEPEDGNGRGGVILGTSPRPRYASTSHIKYLG